MEIFVRGKVQVGKFNIHSQQTNINDRGIKFNNFMERSA